MLATAATTATVSGMEGDDEVDRNSRLDGLPNLSPAEYHDLNSDDL